KRRDISKTIITIAFKEISDVDYYNTFHALAEKKVETIRETNAQKKRKKLADYLFYRGWESHLVYDKIRELIP
ncbi:MAG: regulatory protein, partial [Psychroserpens sp.]